jgi:hypothetical protein
MAHSNSANTKMNIMKKPLPQIALFKVYLTEDGPEVLLYGTPSGLRQIAERILKLADLDQESMENLPNGEGYHIHMVPGPGHTLCSESDPVTIGRIDGKGNGDLSWFRLTELDGSLTSMGHYNQGD